jgi:hypothetical protein
MRVSRSNSHYLETPSKNLRKIKGGRSIQQARELRRATHWYRSDVYVYDATTRAGSSARISLFDRAHRRSLRPLPVAIALTSCTWRLHQWFYENFPHALSVAHQMIVLPPRMRTADESPA